jgi:predicted LPLAT superfamily acyltransferase
MLFVSVMKTGAKRYTATVNRIDVDTEGNTKTRAAALARKYVKLLEKTVKEYPAQWYNYFEFWL